MAEFASVAPFVSATLEHRGVAADVHIDRRDSVNSDQARVLSDSTEHDMLRRMLYCYECVDGSEV